MNLNRLAGAWVVAAAPGVFFPAPAPGGELRIPLPSIEFSISRGDDGCANFSGAALYSCSPPGQPAIPYRTATVLLPPEAEIETVAAEIEGARFEQVPGKWHVRPCPPPAAWDGTKTVVVWPEGATLVNGRDAAVYGSDALFPSQMLGMVESGSMRGWLVASVPVALCRYDPARLRLERLKGGELCISFADVDTARSPRKPSCDRIAAEGIRGLAVNYSAMAPRYLAGENIGTEFSADRYVIITTAAIQAGLADLAAFTLNKQARGLTVQVVTENAWGGGTGNTAAERIRSWLKSNYSSLNIKYVLLIGNPNPSSGDVPMKVCSPYEAGVPTDYYYADLTGNWDLNANGGYGEWSDFGSGGVDRNWEVIVGRIPCYGSAAEANAVLQKIIAYENTPSADAGWRHRVLLPMVPFDGSCPMYQLGEQLKTSAIAPRGWPCHRIYVSSYGLTPPPETVGCSVDNTVAAWNANPHGAVIWATHGSSDTAVAVMDTQHVYNLNDAYPSFTYQGSCSNSHPEDWGNLACRLLQHGCIAAVGATRTSWYHYYQTSFPNTATIGGVGYEYGHRLIHDDMACGDALCDLKQDVPPGYSWCWQNYLVFNVYGDPSLGLSTTLVDADSDGMPDYWEIARFGSIAPAASGDEDSDGFTNIEEHRNGTDPTDADSDDDGLADGAEVHTYDTDPLVADTDGDGLLDGEEIAHGADPNVRDTDGDGLSDGEEVNAYGTSVLSADSDGDGFSDAVEVAGGSDPLVIEGGIPLIRISFQPEGAARHPLFAPSAGREYSPSLGYGWK